MLGPPQKRRQTYSRDVTQILEDTFRRNRYVTKEIRQDLVKKTALDDRQIKIWFQNRRMKAKKETKIDGDAQRRDNQPLSNYPRQCTSATNLQSANIKIKTENVLHQQFDNESRG